MRIGTLSQSLLMLAALVAPGAVCAADVESTALDLRLPREAGAYVPDAGPRCFLKRRCVVPAPRPGVGSAPAMSPRMSLPLGTYGATSFNFNGSRVRMHVSF